MPSSLELVMHDVAGRPQFTCALADASTRQRCR